MRGRCGGWGRFRPFQIALSNLLAQFGFMSNCFGRQQLFGHRATSGNYLGNAPFFCLILAISSSLGNKFFAIYTKTGDFIFVIN